MSTSHVVNSKCEFFLSYIQLHPLYVLRYRQYDIHKNILRFVFLRIDLVHWYNKRIRLRTNSTRNEPITLWAPHYDPWPPRWKPIILGKKCVLSLKKDNDLIKIRSNIKYYITVIDLYLTILTNLSWHTGQNKMLATVLWNKKHFVLENSKIRTDPEQKAKTA